MAQAALKYPTTLDEFLDWEERQPERHEFVDGRVYALRDILAMSGGTVRHDRLTRQLANTLERALEGGPGVVHGPNVKVTTPSGVSAYPDAFIRCGPEDEASSRLDDPIAIFEVLSPGNVHYDLKRKRRAYETIPSLRLIGFVWPDTVAISFAVRDDAGSPWRDDEAEGIDATLVIDALGITIALRDVYVRTGLVLEEG